MAGQLALRKSQGQGAVIRCQFDWEALGSLKEFDGINTGYIMLYYNFYLVNLESRYIISYIYIRIYIYVNH